MIASKSIEILENSAVKLTVSVQKEESKKEYDELLEKYSKTVQIKGFRKGNVPTSVLEHKFGDGIRQEASMNIIDNALKVVFEEIEQKPLHYASPILENEELTLDLDKDFTFTVTYDTFPDVKPGEYKSIAVEEPSVTIGKKEIDRELKVIQDQNAVVIEKKEGGVEKDDIVTINYVEMNGDEEKEDTRREDFVFTVGSGYNLYNLDEDIIGMGKDEEKIIVKDFPEDYSHKELAGQKINLKVKVSTIKVKELPELDDELAQDVNEKFETLKDLKDDIKAKLKETADRRIREDKIEFLLTKILENSTINPPVAMAKAELENSWHNFVAESRMGEEGVIKILAMQGKTKDDLFEEWKPSSEKALKTHLLLDKLVENEKVEVTDEEIDEEIKKQAEASNRTFEETKEIVENNGMIPYLKVDLSRKKMIDLIVESAAVKKGKKINFLDLVQKVQ
jgi:trigger factor